MLAMNLPSALGNKNTVTLLLILLVKTNDVASMRGFSMEEVVIIDTPSPDGEEVVCTIASIENDDSDTKYEKYIADLTQANMLEPTFILNPNAMTFEECASAAGLAGSKMFLFDGDQCKLSAFLFEKEDQCNITQTLMVYIEADAQPDDLLASGLYRSNFLFVPNIMAAASDISTECDKFGAKACAPDSSQDIIAYVNDLKSLMGTSLMASVGLSSPDSGTSYDWITQVSQPMELGRNGWIRSFPDPTGLAYCVKVFNIGLETVPCTDMFNPCCAFNQNAV